mmetsp:Transcript_32592/g.85909  ORF Transcript_32592/g.85909 Transcript_32592/m.85909 type:complete len:245 (+) Transcript_32592:1545-2279(+)
MFVAPAVTAPPISLRKHREADAIEVEEPLAPLLPLLLRPADDMVIDAKFTAACGARIALTLVAQEVPVRYRREAQAPQVERARATVAAEEVAPRRANVARGRPNIGGGRAVPAGMPAARGGCRVQRDGRAARAEPLAPGHLCKRWLHAAQVDGDHAAIAAEQVAWLGAHHARLVPIIGQAAVGVALLTLFHEIGHAGKPRMCTMEGSPGAPSPPEHATARVVWTSISLGPGAPRVPLGPPRVCT